MKVKAVSMNDLLVFDKVLTPKQEANAHKAVKQQLIELYIHDGCKGNVISSQVEDNSNWGRLYIVEI